MTAPEKLVYVRRQLESVPRGDVPLKHLEGLEFEFHHLAARDADEVVVMRTLEGRLIKVPSARREQGLLNESGFDQERQRAIDGGKVRVLDPCATELVDEIADFEMPVVSERDPSNGCFASVPGVKQQPRRIWP